MTEPVLDYGNPASDTAWYAWYAWLQAKDDKQLIVYWAYVRDWSPGCVCGSHENPDIMQMKYELTAQLMHEREL